MTEDEMQNALDMQAHEMGEAASERRWLRWLARCEVLFFGREQGPREQGFDGTDSIDGFSLDSMWDRYEANMSPERAIADIRKA